MERSRITREARLSVTHQEVGDGQVGRCAVATGAVTRKLAGWGWSLAVMGP
jgi:hypothetical protein